MGAPFARETRSAKRLNATRVPVARARAVTWNLSASALRRMGQVLSKAKRFRFGNAFNGDVRGVAWPRELKSIIRFGLNFDQQIEEVTWPPSLELNSCGSLVISSNQPLQGVSWPASLQDLHLPGAVGQPVAGVSWPASLRRLTIGSICSTLYPESAGLRRSKTFVWTRASISLSSG